MWYSTLEFTAEKYEKLDTWMQPPPIILDIYDKDGNPNDTIGDDYLCRSVIQIHGPDKGAVNFLDNLKGGEDISYFHIPEPKWHDCYFKQGDSKSG